MASGDEAYTPVVGSGELEIEIPYRVEQAFDLEVPRAGLRVVYDKPFQTPPALAVSAANEINEWYRVSHETVSGFNIQFYSRASRFGTFGAKEIKGSFDYQARGYGGREWALPTKGQGSAGGVQRLQPRGLGRGRDKVRIIRRAP